MSCTLLLAVCRAVEVDGRPLQFVMACQVGDGMVGVVHRDGRAFPLGAADSGGHAGETEFLTSAGKTDPDFLAGKTDGKVIDMQALLVMTDGVADDYFPGDTHLARLWADLVVNGIPDLTPPPEGVVAADEYGTPIERVMADPRETVTLHSAEAFAERLGTTADELVKHPPRLRAGRRPVRGATAADRLRAWLDAYHVRGSFDDRTLVCIHREDLA